MKLRFGLLIVTLALCACSNTSNVREQDSQATRAATVNVELGAGYMNQGKYDVALSKLNRALDEDPKLPSAHNVIAILYERLGEFEKADTHFRRAVDLAPHDPEVHNNYGTFLCGQNRLKEADKQFLAALKDPLYKTPEFAYTNAGVCALKIPDQAKAEEYFRQALRVNPRFGNALFEMAQLNFNRGNYLPARGFLQRYMEASEHGPAGLWLGVRIERALGDKAAADSYAKVLMTDFPNSRETELLLKPEQHGQSTGH
jgi:type IV pilus assembly protein PilF